MKRKLTKEDVLNWHGSEHSIEELAQVVADIVNGNYDVELLYKEIKDLIE